MKYWFFKAATFALASAALAACGGGGGDASAIQSAGLGAVPVEVPALVTRVEPYERPVTSLTLKREIVLAPDTRPAPPRYDWCGWTQ